MGAVRPCVPSSLCLRSLAAAQATVGARGRKRKGKDLSKPGSHEGAERVRGETRSPPPQRSCKRAQTGGLQRQPKLPARFADA